MRPFYSILIVILCLTAAAALYFFWPSEPAPSSEQSPLEPQEKEANETNQEKTSVSTQTSRETSESESTLETFSPDLGSFTSVSTQEVFRSKYPGDWRFRERDGKLRRVLGGRITLPSTDPKTIAQFAASVAPLFGGPGTSVRGLAQATDSDESAKMKVFLIDQTYQGFPVLNGKLRVSVDMEKSEVVAVNAGDFQELQGELGSAPESRDGVRRLIQTKNSKLNVKSSEIYVWPDKTKRARFVVEAEDFAGSPGPDAHRVIVDAKTGEVLSKDKIAIID